MALARRSSSLPRSRLAWAQAALRWPKAWTTAAGTGRLAMGKFSTARAVLAPYSASAGTVISPIESFSIRVLLMGTD